MEKRWAKNCAKHFQILKHAFFILEKASSKKIVAGIWRFVSMLFLIFEKVMSKKIVAEVLRFVSMPF